MKLSLPVKLGIAVFVIFGPLFTGMALWKPLKVRYYTSRLGSEKMEERQYAARKLLDMKEEEPVFECYTDRYSSKNVIQRISVVDELCDLGDTGILLMQNIFRNHSRKEQVLVPRGEYEFFDGSKTEISPMWVDKYEVTNEKFYVYFRCMKQNVTINTAWGILKVSEMFDSLKITEDMLTEIINYDLMNCPMQDVYWQNADAYAKWAGMRLPLEYEWEYFAGAGSKGRFCFGDNESLLGEYAWYKENSGGKPHPVGMKKPNKWGLYDIHGNVYEMIYDIESNEWEVSSKGGAYQTGADSCRIITGLGFDREYSGENVGFRCVRDVK